MLKTYTALTIILGGAACIGLFLRKYLSAKDRQAITDTVDGSLREGRHEPLILASISGFVDAILGRDATFAKRIRGLFLTSLVLLLIGLSVADLKYGTVFGAGETPWASYEAMVTRMATSAERQQPRAGTNSADFVQSQAAWARTLRVAQQPHWKYIYSVALLLVIVLANALSLFASLCLTRHVAREIATSKSWTSRLGLLFVLILGSLLVGLVCAWVVGALTNPALWVVVLLAKTGISSVWVGLALILADVFAWYVMGPWYKVLVAIPLLPALALLVALGTDLFRDGQRRLLTSTGERIVLPFLGRYRDIVIPWALTAVVVASIYFLIRLLP